VNLWISVSICLAASAGSFWFLFSRVNRGPSGEGNIADWFDNFSLEAYRPMQRLLNEDDYAFLEAQPGYRLSIGKQLRAERKKIFRIYLRQLIGDFNRLVRVAEFLLVHSHDDRPDLVRAIQFIRVRFYCNIVKTELSLLLPVAAWKGSAAVSLIESLSQMRDAIQGSHLEQAASAS